jgi:hypothetical protein
MYLGIIAFSVLAGCMSERCFRSISSFTYKRCVTVDVIVIPDIVVVREHVKHPHGAQVKPNNLGSKQSVNTCIFSKSL